MEKKMQNWRILIGTLLVFLILTAGCASPTFRVHPLLQDKTQTMKVIAVMPPEVKVYRLTAGGVRELMDEWSATSQEHIVKAVQDELSNQRGFTFRLFPAAPATAEGTQALESELEDIKTLYGAVSTSILLHTYVPEHTFPEKIKDFDYSLPLIRSF